METRVGSAWNCLWATLCHKIKNTLREPFTARKDPASRKAPAENQAAAAQGSPRQQQEADVGTQFHRFPDLPAELRIQIWEEATRCKRYVVLDPPCNDLRACISYMWRDIWYYAYPEYAGQRQPLWTSPTPPPALLSVCWEARQVALKVWRPSFACGAFPAAVYINFDQDDVVIGSAARANHDYFGLSGSIDDILRPWSQYVAAMMIGAWVHTPDVEKIQRVVACGRFMIGLRSYATIPEFMSGLKSLTTVRIGNLMEPCSCGHFICSHYGNKMYTRSSRSGKGVPLLSLGDIDFAKTAKIAGCLLCATTRSFAELEILDFDGGTASDDVETCWKLGPGSLGWEPKRVCQSRAVHLGPGKRCVTSSRWYCETRNMGNIWYAI